MADPTQDKAGSSEEPYTPEALTRAGVFFTVLYGIGVSLGLALLWLMEVVRNIYFRILDRFNIKPRRRPASAFPPGQPRKRPQSPVSS